MEISTFPLLDRGNRVVHAVEYIKDITERVSLAERFDQARRLVAVGQGPCGGFFKSAWQETIIPIANVPPLSPNSTVRVAAVAPAGMTTPAAPRPQNSREELDFLVRVGREGVARGKS